MIALMKWCRICDVQKPLSEFPTKGNRPAQCKQCAYDVRKRRKWESQSFSYRCSPRQWAFDDDAWLLVLAAIGMPTRQIANLLGRTFFATREHLQDLRRSPAYAGLIPRASFWTEERKAHLRELIVVKRYSRSQAAKVLKVSANVVIGAVQRYLPEACGKREGRAGI